MDDRWEKKLDEVFTMARGAVWDTEALARGFETRLMARIASEQEERARSLVWNLVSRARLLHDRPSSRPLRHIRPAVGPGRPGCSHRQQVRGIGLHGPLDAGHGRIT